jgi:hypothetical protein
MVNNYIISNDFFLTTNGQIAKPTLARTRLPNPRSRHFPQAFGLNDTSIPKYLFV